jgi:hypothetical protein
LAEIKSPDLRQRDVPLENRCAVIANIKDEPDREKSDNAIQVRLQKIADDIAIKSCHGLWRF